MSLCSKCKKNPTRKSGGYCQPCHTAYNTEWLKRNPTKTKQYNSGRKEYFKAWRNSEYKNNPAFRIRVLLGNRLAEVLRRVSATRSQPIMGLVGCTRAQLKTYLEGMFKPGMTWKNHGSFWHLDHRRPCSWFDLADPLQQKLCFHWSNLQPLYVKENLQKSNK